MEEREERIAVAGGELVGHRGGEGPPMLLLHGGPAIPDYMGACAAELHGLADVIRYTQRGVSPSVVEGRCSIEGHAADALAVLDALEIERAWVVGHSWGGHLALHLLLAYPKRLLGVVCIDALGAYPIFAEFAENLRRALTSEQAAWVDGVEEKRRRGEATETDLIARMDILWPAYFGGGIALTPAPSRIGVACSTETNESIANHFRQETLIRGLPGTDRPALFIHGTDDPLPVSSSSDTAALLSGARVEKISGCGHFPWLDQPGSVRQAVEPFLGPA